MRRQSHAPEQPRQEPRRGLLGPPPGCPSPLGQGWRQYRLRALEGDRRLRYGVAGAYWRLEGETAGQRRRALQFTHGITKQQREMDEYRCDTVYQSRCAILRTRVISRGERKERTGLPSVGWDSQRTSRMSSYFSSASRRVGLRSKTYKPVAG